GDQTPPPRDESFDSDSEHEAEEADDEPEAEDADDEPEAEEADDEPEAEEPDGVPEAVIGAGSQRPFAIRDFPIGVYETGESSTARDPQFIGGLAPWALRRDLEALRRHERIKEAESETGRTEVVEKLKVLENEENATLRKKLVEKEVLLNLTQMVRKGAVPKPPSDDEGSERPRKTSRKSDGDEGPSDPRGPPKIMPPKQMSEARMREIIRDQFATSMNEFMADMNSRAGGPGGASGRRLAVIGAGSQRPFAIRDFPIGVYETGESFTTRDPQFVGGLAPWALRRDLEALRRHERIREAESETGRTEVALLRSEAKIGKMEREILHHDLSSVEETLGKVVEKLNVLENEENATLRKKLVEKDVLLNLTRMERYKAERRLSELIRWNKRFYLEMVRKGAVPKPPSDDEGSERPRKTSRKSDGDEGPSDPRGPPK
nr:hypothetical protein [Tanacetum cinerariifolium]